jgi:hypothetical protein
MDTPNRRTPVFGSIERGLDKVKTIFTPRKKMSSIDTPRKAKVNSHQIQIKPFEN